jgi:hypothetical protein
MEEVIWINVHNHTDEPLAYRCHEATRILGTTEPAVRSLIARGVLPVRRVAGRIWVMREDLERLLQQRTANG